MFIIDILYEVYVLFLEMAPYMLLGLFFVGLLDLFVSQDMIMRHLGGNKYSSIVKAALFGVPLPLCSCGVVPTAVYMAKSGSSKGSVIAFLISTPQTGVDSIVATYGMLGWVFAIFRPLAALVMGVAGGIIIKIANVKEKIEELNAFGNGETAADMRISGFFPKIKRFYTYAFAEFLDGISVQFVIGLIISGLISYYVPDDFFAGSAITQGIWGMLVLIAIGIPMYVCATASIPIAVTLILKGFSPGIAFVFLVAGPATNAASLAILFKVLGKKVTFLYLAIITVFAIIFGYLLDAVFMLLHINPTSLINVSQSCNCGFESYQYLLGGLFFLLILLSIYRLYFKKLFRKKTMNSENESKKRINIEGMECKHCVINVSKAVSSVPGVTSVNVTLEDNAAFVEGNFDFSQIKKAIEGVGYKVVD